MTNPAQRSARLELDSARSAVARMDGSRGAEDTAADLIETWVAVEAALRALVGSTVLSGQPLIREARQRQLLNFDQANSLAEFQAARDRVHDTTYRPTEADINAARGAFLKLDTALTTDMTADPTRVIAAPASASATGTVHTGAPPVADAGPVKVVGPPRRFPIWLLVTTGVVVVGVVLLIILRPFARGGSDSLQQGIDAYRNGQREAAVSAFNRAVRDNKNSVLPHVYLARMAREVGNFTLANQELQLALEVDPGDATALREMGANLLAQGNFELSRRFYVRAIQADPADKTSQGYLGCVLVKLNRQSEATNFFNRAGPGPWNSCTPGAPVAPGTQAPKSVPR